MSLDGIRAWIGLLERKLTMRTRVFLVLVAIAVGAAAVGIVLAVDAQNDAITKSDLETVRGEIEDRTGSAAGGDAELATLEAELRELRDEVAELRGGGKQPGDGTSDRGSDGTSDGGSSGASTDIPPALRELAEKAKEQSAK
jgi:hypothetical protein